MNMHEAVVIVLIIVVIVALARQTGRGLAGGAKAVGEAAKDDATSWASGDKSFYGRIGQELANRNASIGTRVGVRNDAAGWGSSRQALSMDPPATRNGSYMSPERLAEAEQSAWAPYSASATPHYDVMKGRYPGSDLTQQLGQYQEGDWAQQISDLALDPRTREQHRKWVDEVGPYSQTAFSVDNLDEAVAMAQPRVGITAFRALTPAQSSCTLQLTELDAEQHAQQFKPFSWNRM